MTWRGTLAAAVVALAASLLALVAALADRLWPAAPAGSNASAYENYRRVHVVCPNAAGSQNGCHHLSIAPA